LRIAPSIGSSTQVVRPLSPSSKTVTPAPSAACMMRGQRWVTPKRPPAPRQGWGTAPQVLESP